MDGFNRFTHSRRFQSEKRTYSMEEYDKETPIRNDILATSVVEDNERCAIEKPIRNHLLSARYVVALTIFI